MLNGGLRESLAYIPVPVQPGMAGPRRPFILSGTEDFRTRRSPSPNATPPGDPAPHQDHTRAAPEPECTLTTPAGPRSAPVLTSPNRLNVRNGSVAGPGPNQLGLERHGGRVPAGLWARIVQRLLALNACIWHNWMIGAPVKRSLIAYDH